MLFFCAYLPKQFLIVLSYNESTVQKITMHLQSKKLEIPRGRGLSQVKTGIFWERG